MNLKKIIEYAAGIIVLGTALVACNSGSGSPRSNGDQGYGQLVSGGKAESNPTLTYDTGGLVTNVNPISMAILNTSFATAVINPFTPQAYLKAQNESYINNTPSIFGLSSNEFVQYPPPDPIVTNKSYVAYQSGAAGVSAAGYDAIVYTTSGAPYVFAGGATSINTVSGLVVLPLGTDGVTPLTESQIKGVVLYFHPTVLSKAGVPSGIGNSHESLANGEPSWDDQSTFYTQFELASIYASDGYIVIAPDYIGQGIDTGTVHPYVLLPEPNALSGINMLQALNTYLQESYGINLANTKNKSLFISSYSEGGSYALKAASLLGGQYANVLANIGLTLKGTVGVSGVYDLTNAELPFAFDNAHNNPGYNYPSESNYWNASPGCEFTNPICQALIAESATYASYFQAWAQYDMASAKPPLGTYMVNTLVTYNYTPAAYNLVFRTPYADQRNCLEPASLGGTYNYVSCQNANIELSIESYYSPINQSYDVMNLFNTVGLDQHNIGDQLFNAAAYNGFFIGSYTNTPELIAALEQGIATNSVSPFINSSLLQDPFVMSLVAKADTYNLTVNTPVSLIAAKYDSTVTNLDYMSACGMLGANGNIHDNSINPSTGNSYVTCVHLVDNSQLFGNVNLFGDPTESLPIYMNHQALEATLQIAAHNQMVIYESAN